MRGSVHRRNAMDQGPLTKRGGRGFNRTDGWSSREAIDPRTSARHGRGNDAKARAGGGRAGDLRKRLRPIDDAGTEEGARRSDAHDPGPAGARAGARRPESPRTGRAGFGAGGQPRGAGGRAGFGCRRRLEGSGARARRDLRPGDDRCDLRLQEDEPRVGRDAAPVADSRRLPRAAPAAARTAPSPSASASRAWACAASSRRGWAWSRPTSPSTCSAATAARTSTGCAPGPSSASTRPGRTIRTSWTSRCFRTPSTTGGRPAWCSCATRSCASRRSAATG